ncbi:ABC transporter ATP-binding protein [Geovibrio thiophilus]|uniref:ABC transporter ATP-binding protein n=1 Tax=Geovibrio thiophilus TaxID=139438 RepID=A0A410K0D6_9BACT|nr:dipeptide ABC transporter ATP-binding protein [Geovibrio thiophilus]QAR33775.1 ABC transporter ATP-binding protein [Geovibrio thiophilus]
MTEKLLEIKNLKITFDTEAGRVEAVRDFSFDVRQGETLAVVGESGSGKSVCAHSITGLMRHAGAVVEGGSISFCGLELTSADENTLRRIRGGEIGYIFQEPMASLNPLHNIEKQITERLTAVERMSGTNASARALELLRLVGIKNPEKRLGDFPHCFSGGERQRIMIAAALASSPKLLIADEPTTALDVTVQKQILDLLAELKAKLNMSVLLITHDLGVVRAYADRVVVVKDGLVMEEGHTEKIFSSPEHLYTAELVGRGHVRIQEPPEGGDVVLSASDLSVTYNGRAKFGKKNDIKAVKSVSFEVREGHSLGIVGESGSGKTSVMKAILRLIPSEGSVMFMDEEFSSLMPEKLRSRRRHIQAVFQDPFGSLNPRMTVEMIVAEGLAAHGEKDKGKIELAARKALEDVGLPFDVMNRYPHEFSGGQRQRIAIARAIILRPKLVIFDEPTSSLDRSVQFQVTELLAGLQKTYNMSYIFISHDLHLVRSLCHEVIVMKDGEKVEEGTTETVLSSPESGYTKSLIGAAFI